MRQSERERADRYIGQVRWQFAKTMPQCPHFYTLQRWAPALWDEFRWFCHLIPEYGWKESFAGRPQTYLYVGEWKYWIMSGPDEAILINRARV